MAHLAKDLSLHRSTISGHLRDRNIALHEAPQMTQGQIDRAVELYESGLSLVKIGKRLGFNQAAIHNQLKRRGVRFRSPHGGLGVRLNVRGHEYHYENCTDQECDDLK